MAVPIFIRITTDASPKVRGREILLQPPLTMHGDKGVMAMPPIPSALQDRYLGRLKAILSDLAVQNLNPDWWYLPVSEVQPNMSNLLQALETEAQLEALLCREIEGAFVLKVPNAEIATYLLDRQDAHEAFQLTASALDRFAWRMRPLKRFLQRFLNAALWWAEHARSLSRVRGRGAPLPKTLHTLFVTRFEADLESPDPLFHQSPWSDRYLGDLIEAGFQRAKKTMVVGRSGANAAALSAMAAKYRRFPVRIFDQMLKQTDLIRILWRAWRLKLRMKGGTATSRLVVSESRNHLRAVADCVLVETAMRRLLEKTTPKQILCMQENSVWEHAVVRAAREAARTTQTPAAKLIGYFHCPVMPSAMRYHTSTELLQSRPMFDAIVPLGAEMAQSLRRLGPWESRLCPGYGFRNPDIAEGLALGPEPPETPFPIVVLLGGAFDNGVFLKWVNAARQGLPPHRLLLKGHPVYGSEAACKEAGIDLSKADDIVEIASPRMKDALQGAGCVIYKGTTAGLSALAAGVPVIHVEHSGLQTDDTLFNADALAKSVGDVAEFQAAVRSVMEMGMEARAQWATRAKEYAAHYYELSNDRRDQILELLFSDAEGASDRCGA